MRHILPVVGIVFAGATLLSTGGLGSPRDDVRTVARTFMQAAAVRDTRTLQELMTQKAGHQLAKNPVFITGNENAGKVVTVGEPIIYKDHASILVHFNGSSDRSPSAVQLRQESGQWRVYALYLLPISGGPTVTLDFEHPILFNDGATAPIEIAVSSNP